MPADLPGDSASYLATGLAADMPTPPGNVAPNTVARYYQTDTGLLCDWIAQKWTCEVVRPVPPPPPPGPTFDQWCCNLAHYVIYEYLRVIVQETLRALPVAAFVDAVEILIIGVLSAALPEIVTESPELYAALHTFTTAYVVPHLAGFGAALASNLLWPRLHCILYDQLIRFNGNLQLAIAGSTSIIAALTLAPEAVLTGLILMLDHMGVANIGAINVKALLTNYDCSTCATTGQGPASVTIGPVTDLTVSDGLTDVTFVDVIDVVGASVSSDGRVATITVPQAAIIVDDGVTRLESTEIVTFSGATVAAGAAHEAVVTVPAPGIEVTDGITDLTGVLVLNVSGAAVSGTTPSATLTIPVATITVDDGSTRLEGISLLSFSGATVAAGATGEAVVTIPQPGLELTDGTHDKTGVFKLTVTGATVGGTSPNATLTIPVATIGVDDGVHILAGISELTFSGAVVSAGSTGQAIVTITPPLELTDGTHDLTAVSKVTVTGATVGGSPTAATLVIPGLELTDGTHDLTRVTKVTASGATVGGTAGAATLTVPIYVSSVALTVPAILTVTGSPVTTTGTLAVSLATQAANTALRGPASGSAAAPTFRAALPADLASGAVTGTFLQQSAGALAWAVAPGTLELTDGFHDLTSVTKITVTGLTVGGTAAAATLTVNNAFVFDEAVLIIPAGQTEVTQQITFVVSFGVYRPYVWVSTDNDSVIVAARLKTATSFTAVCKIAYPVATDTTFTLTWLATQGPATTGSGSTGGSGGVDAFQSGSTGGAGATDDFQSGSTGGSGDVS